MMAWGISRPMINQKPNKVNIKHPQSHKGNYDTNKAYFDWMNQSYSPEVDDILELFMKERLSEGKDT